MLKARVSAGRQTRSRTAKSTPKRASAPAKATEAEAPQAGSSVPRRATAPASAAEDKKSEAGVCSADLCMLLTCGCCMQVCDAAGWFLCPACVGLMLPCLVFSA